MTARRLPARQWCGSANLRRGWLSRNADRRIYLLQIRRQDPELVERRADAKVLCGREDAVWGTLRWVNSPGPQALIDLLVDMFTIDEFLRRVAELSEEARRSITTTSPTATFDEGVRALVRRGLVDEFFFERLRQLRPRRQTEIEVTQRLSTSPREHFAGFQGGSLARAFWKPFLPGRTTMTVGAYYESNVVSMFESSSLIGLGDALGMAEILRLLRALIGRETEVLPANSLPAQRRTDNLVLLGGPDANKLTRDLLRWIDCSLHFGDADRHEIAIYDDREPRMVFVPRRGPNFQILDDFALVFRFPNPMNPLTSVAVLAGSFGHGTHAAAQWLCTHGQALAAPAQLSAPSCAFLLATDVEGDWPIRPRLLRSAEVSLR